MSGKRYVSARHLDRLSPMARDAISDVNASTTIGPFAKGDGDLIQWWIAIVRVLVVEFGVTVAGKRPKFVKLHVPNVPQKLPRETQGRFFARLLQSYAYAVIADFFVDLTDDQRREWERLYDEVLVPEMGFQWGGRVVRIPHRRKPTFDPETVIAEGLRAGLNHLELFKAAGVSRATGFRILKRTSKP